MAPKFVILRSVDDGVFFSVVPDIDAWLDKDGFEKDGSSIGPFGHENNTEYAVPELDDVKYLEIVLATMDAEGRVTIVENENNTSVAKDKDKIDGDQLIVVLDSNGIARNITLSHGVDPAWLWGLDVHPELQSGRGELVVPFGDYEFDSEFDDPIIRWAHRQMHELRRLTVERLSAAPFATHVMPGTPVRIIDPSSVDYGDVLEGDCDLLHSHYDLGDPACKFDLLNMHLVGLLPDDDEVVESEMALLVPK